jgi:hypothetical protein
MKDQALALARGAADRGRALNTLREYLQSLVLRSFHDSEAFRCLAFVGGTALPFLERPQDASLITRDNLLGLLEK